MASWNIDNAHSAIHFTVRHMMFAKVRGRFSKWSAELDLKADDLTQSKVSADIDVGSITTGEPDRDTHLKSGDFFDAEKFPKIKFESRSVKKQGDHYVLTGDLTIRDVTRSIDLEVEELGRGKDPWGNQRVGFSAKGQVNRKDFGLKWNQALETGGVLIGEKVEIEIETEVVQKSQAA
jgi:polyisoprenoid-binding protein YceI